MALTALHRFGHEDLNPGEEIIYRAHLHFAAFLYWSKTWIIYTLFGLFLLVLAFIFRQEIGFLIDGMVTLGVFLFAGLFLVYGGYKFSVRIIDWLYDEDIITNQRVIDYNQKFLFSRDVTTADMKSIQSIILDQPGLLRTLFNYGNLNVQTAASSGHIRSPGKEGYLILSDISQPKKVQRLIDEIAYRVKKEVTIDREEVLKVCGLK